MATDNAIRITVRIVIPDSTYPPTAIDLAIPQQSSIADILDEVLDLAGAPTISRPWQATTAAGTAIDAAEPLSHTQLTHGSTLILSPHHDLEPPVLCDAAEALANQPDSATYLGLNSIITGVGVALALCCVFSPVAAAVPLWARLLCAGLIAFAVALKIPADSQGSNRTTTLCILCIAAVSCTFAAGLCMILPPPLSLDDLAHTPWAIAAAAGCAALMLAACHALVAPPPQLVVAIATILVTLTLSSLSLVLRPTPSSVAAATIAVAVIAIIASPWLALRISGLKVPRLPAPGQGLHVTDTAAQENDRFSEAAELTSDDRARRTVAILEGILVGVATCAFLAMLALTTRGDGYTAGLCLACAAAVLAHATRHRSAVALWALWIWGSIAIAALGICLLHANQHTMLFALTVSCALITISTQLWAHHLKELSPTTLNWVERFESLAVAATIPLAAHIVGIFSLIRGLG